MHFLGHLVLALAVIIAAMVVAFAFRFTPVAKRSFSTINPGALVAQKNDFGSALQNLYWELERAEDLVGPG
jgi:hypothetical protein